MTDAPIPWPRAYRKGRVSLILCGDLIRAVRTESETAIAHHWGVGITTVLTWRRALGVKKWTPGTKRLISYYIQQGQKASQSDESRRKMSAAKRGRPLTPQCRAAGVKASQRPKSEAWKRKMSAVMKKQWAAGSIRQAQIAKRKSS
jgi:hypothetical protein